MVWDLRVACKGGVRTGEITNVYWMIYTVFSSWNIKQPSLQGVGV